jgi:hypothetical protein
MGYGYRRTDDLFDLVCLLKLFVSEITSAGTSDEHMSIVECLREYRPDGAILVTTPQVRVNPKLEKFGQFYNSMMEWCDVTVV